MIVYLVEEWDWEGSWQTIGVYSSLDNANKACEGIEESIIIEMELDTTL